MITICTVFMDNYAYNTRIPAASVKTNPIKTGVNVTQGIC